MPLDVAGCPPQIRVVERRYSAAPDAHGVTTGSFFQGESGRGGREVPRMKKRDSSRMVSITKGKAKPVGTVSSLEE